MKQHLKMKFRILKGMERKMKKKKINVNLMFFALQIGLCIWQRRTHGENLILH